MYPSLFWGQDDEYIHVKVTNISDAHINIDYNDDNLTFNSPVYTDIYPVSLNLYLPVIPEYSRQFKYENVIKLKLKKQYVESWPRLTHQREKIPWIKPDFDFILDPDSPDDDEEAEIHVKFDKPTPEERQKRKEEEDLALAKEDWDNFIKLMKNPIIIYLLVVYIFQLAGSLYTVYFISNQYLRQKVYDYVNFYPVLDRSLILFLVSFLELGNILFKFDKTTNLFLSLKNLTTRLVIWLLVFVPVASIVSESNLYFLFLITSIEDTFRLIESIFSLLGEEYFLLEYINHSVWIFTYPAAFILEVKLLMLSANEFYGYRLIHYFTIDHLIYIYLFLRSIYFYTEMKLRYKLRKMTIGPNPKFGAEEMSGLQALLGYSYIEYVKKKNNAKRLKNQTQLSAKSIKIY